MSSNPVIPAGIISIMRQLAGTDGMPLAALQGDYHTLEKCLHIMRDVYGAAVENARGWTLTYQPQWMQASSLPLSAKILEETISTQQAIRCSPPPCAVFTEHQTAGYGTQGRGWIGLPADALALSVRLPKPAQSSGLSVALGAMLAAALADGALYFKWPNDIVNCHQHKVAGILTEITGDSCIVGVGVNWHLTQTLAAHIKARGNTPAALADMPHSIISRQHCAQIIIETIIETLAAYDSGFAPFHTIAQQTHIAAVGDRLEFSGVSDTFLGFSEEGALLTSSGSYTSGVQYVVSG